MVFPQIGFDERVVGVDGFVVLFADEGQKGSWIISEHQGKGRGPCAHVDCVGEVRVEPGLDAGVNLLIAWIGRGGEVLRERSWQPVEVNRCDVFGVQRISATFEC